MNSEKLKERKKFWNRYDESKLEEIKAFIKRDDVDSFRINSILKADFKAKCEAENISKNDVIIGGIISFMKR